MSILQKALFKNLDLQILSISLKRPTPSDQVEKDLKIAKKENEEAFPTYRKYIKDEKFEEEYLAF